MRIHNFVLLVAALMVPIQIFAETNKQEAISILEIGVFHGNEVPKIIGNHWIALTAGNIKSELIRVQPKITNAPDPMSADDSDRSGKKVEIENISPILIINSPSLQPGEIEQARIEETPWGQKIHLRNVEYMFLRKCGEKNESGMHACKVYLSTGNVSQFITETWEGPSDNSSDVEVKWAGDIDRDGKIDLILYHSTNNRTSTSLHLSSSAKLKQLVNEVAVFSKSGC